MFLQPLAKCISEGSNYKVGPEELPYRAEFRLGQRMLSLVAFSLNESIAAVAAATIDESNTVTQLKLVPSR